MNETKTRQVDFYGDLPDEIDNINSSMRFEPRTERESTILKNVEKIVLGNKGDDLAIIDKITKYVVELDGVYGYVRTL